MAQDFAHVSNFTGPVTSTDNAIARYDGTTGMFVQNSELLVADTTGEITRATVGADLILDGNTIFNPDLQLVAADFPNATTLYGQNMDSASADAVAGNYTGGTFGTAKTFVVRGAELTAAADVLGDTSHYCVFGGSAYLECTDATIIAATGTFSVPIWVYQANWATTAADGIVSCTSANMQNGWEMKLTTTEDLTVCTYKANATAVMTLTASTAGLSAGWHHICWVHTNVASDKLYIDGNLVASAADTTNDYVAGGLELCLGASNNHTALLTGRLDEFALHSATALTADQVKAIYARSAKKFAVKDANTNVFIPELNVASGVYTPMLTAQANCDGTPTMYPAIWARNGDKITVFFRVNINPTTATGTDTYITFTLPIACATTPTLYGSASGNSPAGVAYQAAIIYPASATELYLNFNAMNVTSSDFRGSFSYVLN